MPFNEYMKLLAQVNVSVDQLYSYSLAMNALYSMAQGKIVVGGAEPESGILYDGKLPPVYNALPDEGQLFKTLESILERKEDLNSDSEKSRQFIIEQHNPLHIASTYLDIWNRLS